MDADNYTKSNEIHQCDCYVMYPNDQAQCVNEKCLNYATMTECVICGPHCNNRNIQRV